jgi:NhaP-type Na+/H+ or K+/H+ antiporter
LIIAAIVAGALVTLGMSLKVWFSDNEDAKKQLKLARSKFFHTIGYIFLGLIFIEVFWMWILPPIWSWAASANSS